MAGVYAEKQRAAGMTGSSLIAHNALRAEPSHKLRPLSVSMVVPATFKLLIQIFIYTVSSTATELSAAVCTFASWS